LLLNGGAATTSTYNAGNELATSQSSAGVTSFAYDGNGNLLTTQAPGNQWTTNSWDGENRLTRVALPSGVVDSFTYNGDGQRVQKQDLTGTTNHVWDGENIILETNASNIIQAVYTLQPLYYGNLISQSRGGVDSFYLFDALGSARELVSGTGSIADTYLYDSFGNLILVSGSTVNPFRYVGRLGYYFDIDLSTYSLRARSYNPQAGRFIARDPLFIGGRNAYSYAANQPVSAIDPGGTLTITPVEEVLGDLNCGTKPSVTWDITVKPSVRPCQGWLVQKLNFFCRVYHCDTRQVDEYIATVYEAIESANGVTVTDTQKSNCKANTQGIDATSTEIRFYCDEVIDESKDDPNDWEFLPIVGSGGCEFDIGQQGKTAEPKFWDKKYRIRDGPAFDSFEARWLCCPFACFGQDKYCRGSAKPS